MQYKDKILLMKVPARETVLQKFREAEGALRSAASIIGEETEKFGKNGEKYFASELNGVWDRVVKFYTQLERMGRIE